MNTTENIHDWFTLALEAYVTGGLTPDERRKFEAHAAMCVACDAALTQAKNADTRLRDLFTACAPPPTFEDRLIEQLRSMPQRHRWIHPAVWRYAGGIAAVILLGGFGFIGNHMMKDGKFPEFAMPRMAFLMPKISRQGEMGVKRQHIPDDAWAAMGHPDTETLSIESRTQAGMEHEYREKFDTQMERSLNSAEEKRIPYDDFLRYPPNWPDISEVRDASIRSERGAKELDAAIGFRSSPSDGPARWALKTPDQLASEVKTTVSVPDGGTLLIAGQTINGMVDNRKSRVITADADVKQLFWNANNRNHRVDLNGGTLLLGGQTVNGAVEAEKSRVIIANGDGNQLDWYYANANKGDSPVYGNVSGIRSISGSDNSYTGGTVVSGGATLDVSGKLDASSTMTKNRTITPKLATVSAGMVESIQGGLEKKADIQLGYLNTAVPKPADAHYFTPPGLEKPPTTVIQREPETKQFPLLATKLGDVDVDKKAEVAQKLEVATKELDVEMKRSPQMAIQAEKPGEAKPADTGKVEPAEPSQPATPPPAVQTPVPPGTPTVAQRKIIRNGQMEFEVDSFDSSFIQIGKIAAEESGYIASTDSEKLSNGKVKGTITLRVPPDHLDVLVLKLRGLGELKTQRITAQDVTKQYTDFESQLKAAHTMEDRLLEIIKSGKGEVKDLVEAEKQLDINRQKIEQIEGELRYYNNMVSLSTLNITLFERDIKAPSAAFETEEVQAGIEAEDVEKARAEALKAIDEFKGRVIESNLRKLEAGQLAATIIADVSPESTGPLTDRLKQLGRVVRMEAERKQTTTGGVGAPTSPKLERKPTRFNISLYNLANIAPREMVNVTLAAADVDAAYKAILGVMRGDGAAPQTPPVDVAPIGRVVSSSLNAQKMDQASGTIALEVKTDKIATIEAAFRAVGTVMHYTVTENPDANNVTRAKRGYSIALVSTAQVPPRETQNLSVAAKNVPSQYQKLLGVLQDSKQPARIVSSQLNEQDRQNITGSIDFEISRSTAPLVESVLANGTDSDVYSRIVGRSNDTENTLDTKVHMVVSLINADRLAPREMTTIGVDVGDVEKAMSDAVALAEGSGGRVLDRRLYKLQNGQIGAHAVLDVPLQASAAALDRLRGLGTVRSVDASKNQQVPEGPLARARFDVTLGDGTPLVSPEDGVGSRLRQGLQASVKGLTVSLMLIVIGVCLVGPFLLVGWILWKLFRRRKVMKA